MSKSQTLKVVVSGNRPIILEPHTRYQMLVSGFGSVQFVNLETGDYLPDSLLEED